MGSTIQWVVAALAIGAAGCGELDPCDEYVDYMCACHADDIDCDDLALTYRDAEPDIQDECAVLLNDQEQADQDAQGTGAGTGTGQDTTSQDTTSQCAGG
ncbi:MAG: hypothetical protein ABMB14_35355 [Myxococcota bacterium]